MSLNILPNQTETLSCPYIPLKQRLSSAAQSQCETITPAPIQSKHVGEPSLWVFSRRNVLQGALRVAEAGGCRSRRNNKLSAEFSSESSVQPAAVLPRLLSSALLCSRSPTHKKLQICIMDDVSHTHTHMLVSA